MGFLKDLIVGAVAYKALKRSDRPGVVAPSTCTVIGMEHKGMGSTWKITYIENSSPNLTRNFTISPGVTSRTQGSEHWKFYWN